MAQRPVDPDKHIGLSRSRLTSLFAICQGQCRSGQTAGKNQRQGYSSIYWQAWRDDRCLLRLGAWMLTQRTPCQEVSRWPTLCQSPTACHQNTHTKSYGTTSETNLSHQHVALAMTADLPRDSFSTDSSAWLGTSDTFLTGRRLLSRKVYKTPGSRQR